MKTDKRQQFRPRMNWELRAASPGLPEELVDGGIADNLPIVPVFRFLFFAGYEGRLKLRPTSGPANEGRPHLLLTASLEPKKRNLDKDELHQTAECWPTLKRRVGQLQYNVKVDSHRQTQSDLRKIRAALAKQNKQAEVDLPDLHVSCVKPEWLCGTFAFHPMLGFKRERQASSIAHGCATTLVHLHCEQSDHPEWTPHWWNPFELHDADTCLRDTEADISYTLNPRPATDCGDCCFVRGKKCPFSKTELQRLNTELATDKKALGKETIEALNEIYHFCGKQSTHRPPEE